MRLAAGCGFGVEELAAGPVGLGSLRRAQPRHDMRDAKSAHAPVPLRIRVANEVKGSGNERAWRARISKLQQDAALKTAALG
jgi:hypothetical protein